MFSPEQIEELIKNNNVIRCSPKSITYCQNFKLSAVKKHLDDGLGPNLIFKQAGFNLNVIGKSKPKACLYCWEKIYVKRGGEALLKENRGGLGTKRPRPKIPDNNIGYLQTKIAYLEAENDFLAKLRGLKRE